MQAKLQIQVKFNGIKNKKERVATLETKRKAKERGGDGKGPAREATCIANKKQTKSLGRRYRGPARGAGGRMYPSPLCTTCTWIGMRNFPVSD